jgi:hypothetical protein
MAPLREAAEGETPEELEAERQAAQNFTDNGKLTFRTNVHRLTYVGFS